MAGKIKTIGHVLLALLIVCLAPISIWVAAGSALYQHRKMRAAAKNVSKNQVCTLDSDCPPGYICLNGICVLDSSL